MKNSTAFAAAGFISLFAAGAACAQTAQQVPITAGAGVTRQPVGSRFRNPPPPEGPVIVSPAPETVPEAIYWTGAYIGGDFGGSFASTSISSNTLGWGSHSLDSSGVMGGGYAGYNYQVNPNFVLGLEGDFQGVSSSANYYYPRFDVAPSIQQDWVASLNGRLGITYQRALFYAIGGGAWGQGSATVTPGLIRFPPTLQQRSHTADLSGWDVGGGVEYAFSPRWVGRLEYRYYDFGSFNANNVGIYLPLHVQASINTVRVGLAYLFGPPAAPVVAAKY